MTKKGVLMGNSIYLRENTRKQHTEIEAALDLKKLVSDKSRYIKILKSFLGYYLEIERELIKFEKDFLLFGLNLNSRFKSSLLQEDLKKFAIDDDQLPLAPIKPIRNSLEAWGVLYVLEGSTLGGQIIFSELKEAKIIKENGEGGQFFYSYGKETALRWQEFKAVLNKLETKDRTPMLRAAQETFISLKDWLVNGERK